MAQDQEHLQALVINDRPYELELVEMDPFEKIDKYHDTWCFLTLRKKVWYLKCLLTFLCQKIVNSKWFDNVVLVVILWNTCL